MDTSKDGHTTVYVLISEDGCAFTSDLLHWKLSIKP